MTKIELRHHAFFCTVKAMKEPVVSIIMATYNRSKSIADAIKSILHQSYQDWELIISDDSEGNDTEKEMEKFKRDERIRYFHREKKGSIANSSNFALSKSKGEFVAILDDDDWWIDSEKLKKQIAFLRAHPEYVACGGGFVVVDEAGKETGRIKKPEKDDAIRATALSANPIANSTAMFRRSAGVFYDESLPQFADWDFWLTIGTKGKLYNFPEYFLAYRMWEKSASFMYQKTNANAALRIINKHKDKYPGFIKAIFLARLYWCYSKLPPFIRRNFNAALSRLKKRIFS